jgi:hypothetical protein
MCWKLTYRRRLYYSLFLFYLLIVGVDAVLYSSLYNLVRGMDQSISNSSCNSEIMLYRAVNFHLGVFVILGCVKV